MKFFEPDHVTITAEAQQWGGVFLLVTSTIGVALWAAHHGTTFLDMGNLIVMLPWIPWGAYFAYAGYQRKRIK